MVIDPGTSLGLFVKDTTDFFGIGATINAAGAFVAKTGPVIRRVTASPDGTTSDFGGSLALDVTGGKVYVNTSAAGVAGTTWSVLSAVPTTGRSGYQIYSQATAITNIANNAASGPVTGLSIALASNLLSVGSTIRIRMAGTYAVAVANSTLTFNITLGSLTAAFTTDSKNFGSSYTVVADFQIYVKTAGGAGTCGSSVLACTPTAASGMTTSAALDTTASNIIAASVTNGAANNGTNFALQEFDVFLVA